MASCLTDNGRRPPRRPVRNLRTEMFSSNHIDFTGVRASGASTAARSRRHARSQLPFTRQHRQEQRVQEKHLRLNTTPPTSLRIVAP